MEVGTEDKLRALSESDACRRWHVLWVEVERRPEAGDESPVSENVVRCFDRAMAEVACCVQEGVLGGEVCLTLDVLLHQ